MPYQIDRYNGSLFTTVPDQTVDSSSCDLKLIGKNYAGYGEVTNENILHLLENFRGFSAPTRPITGQIWYDELTNKLKFYDDTQRWKTVSITDVSATAPTGLANKDKGNIWYDDTLKQINVWDGANYITIGPEISVGFGETRLRSGTVRDNSNIEHAIIKVFNDDEVLAVISSDEFSIGTIDQISGFTVVKKGITLVNTPSTGVTTNDYSFWGSSSNALKFQGLSLSDFVLRSPSGSTFTDEGVTLGNDSDLKVFVEDSNKIVLASQLNGPIKIRITNGLVDNDVAIFSETGIDPNTTNSYNLGSSSKKWKEAYVTNLYGNVRGTLQGNLLATDDQIMFNGGLKEFYGTHIGTNKGNIEANDGAVVFDATSSSITAVSGTFTSITTNTFTLVDKVIGDLRGDIFAEDDTNAYNAGTKTFTGSLIGNAETASRLSSNVRINGVIFDGSTNITVSDPAAVPKAGGQMSGFLTLHDAPLEEFHAATKKYVDDQIASKTLYFSLDTKGLSLIGAGAGSVAGLLNELAPPSNFPPGTFARIASTIQNVSSTTSVSKDNYISISYVTNVSVTTTISNPTRNNFLMYRVNSIGSSWEYVSG